MKSVVIITIVAVVMIGMIVPSAFATSIDELMITEITANKITFTKFDVIFVNVDLTNNGLKPISLTLNADAHLIDEDKREFSMISHFDVYDLGISPVPECSTALIGDMNPGVPEEMSLCFKVPKDSFSFSLKISDRYGNKLMNKLYMIKTLNPTQTSSTEKETTETSGGITWKGAPNSEQDGMYFDGISSDTRLVCGVGTIPQDGKCVSKESQEEGGGCLIATATYGSEMSNEVQQLRELRDNQLLNTESGTAFMSTFNDVYYSFSPVIADYERENPLFKEAVNLAITPLISSLSILNYVDMDSESEVLGYGISLILLNLGMYLGVPAVVIVGIRKIK